VEAPPRFELGNPGSEGPFAPGLARSAYVLPASIVTVLFAFISTVHVFVVVESQPDVAQMGASFAKAGAVMVTTIGTTVPDGNNVTGHVTLS